MSEMPNPVYNVTKLQMAEFLAQLLKERASQPAETQMADNSSIIIAAMQELLSEFDNTDDLMHMLGRLPWVS